MASINIYEGITCKSKYPNSPANHRMFTLRFCTLSGQSRDGSLDDAVDGLSVAVKHAPQFAEMIADGLVLDLGCGYGSSFIQSTKDSYRKPRRIVHFDADLRVFTRDDGDLREEERAELNEYWKNDPKVCGDAHMLPFGDNKFNVVHMHGTLWDNYDPIEGVRVPLFNRASIQAEISRVLIKGGFYYGDCAIKGQDEAIIEGFREVPTHLSQVALYQKI